ncbi:MAG: glycosyltransferase family 9 protein, partial [Desulfobaccales bacterium]
DQSLELWITGEDEDFARHLLESQGYHGKDFLIALVPGAAQKGKQWPLANFIDLGSKLIKEYQAWIVVIGGKTDEALGQGLKKGLGEKVIDATGQTTLRQAAAVLSHCDLYVGNDSGPMHLAAAMQVPVVEISRFPTGGRPLSPQAPARFEPWGVPHRVLQPDRPAPPCHGDSCMAEEAHCIRRITVEQVEIAIADLLRLKRGIS